MHRSAIAGAAPLRALRDADSEVRRPCQSAGGTRRPCGSSQSSRGHSVAQVARPSGPWHTRLHGGRADGRRRGAANRHECHCAFSLPCTPSTSQFILRVCSSFRVWPLGFTHCCGTDRQGRFKVLRLTVKKRMRATLDAIRAELMRRRRESVAIVGKDVARNNFPVCPKELGCAVRRKTCRLASQTSGLQR